MKSIKELLKKPLLVRIAVIAVLFMAGLVWLIFNLVNAQFIKAEQYREGAFQQYTTENLISPKRGTIYDRNMTELAVSADVENVFLSPLHIEEEQEQMIADYLSEILEVDKETILTRMSNKKSQYQIVKRKVEREVTDKIRAWMIENKIDDGIHFENETKRYYPNGNLASHVLGFTNSENAGVYGIEAMYENYLKGVPGKVITAQNGVGQDMPFDFESYISAQNGTNVVLTIDWSIQNFLEKALESALVDTKARNRVLGIVMDVNTGEILAMSTKPDYDPNSPNTLDAASQLKYDSFEGTDEEKTAYFKSLIEELWKNKAVTELYEPGSTFKLVTSAIALEENKVGAHDSFHCTGVLNVAGTSIHCHKAGGHGTETFEQGLQNSCNPVFMQLAARIGKTTFYKYFEDFGCMDKTGIDLPGEASSIYHTDLSGFNDVELAVYSFGQTFKITPIQLITAVSAVANGGNLMEPYVVRELVDDDGNTVERYEPTVVRQIISKETSDTIMRYLAAGIDVGSTKNAYVKGYSVAAKTGTSQKRDKFNPITGEKDLLIGSCVGFAPADDPQVAVLIAIDEPIGDYYGGVIAAPVVSQVLTDVLPYLNIAPQLSESEKESMEVAVENYRSMTVTEAKNRLAQKELGAKVIGNGEVVTEQFPKSGTYISGNGVVILYTGDSKPAQNVTVPNVLNYSASEANKTIINHNLNISMEGTYREGVSGAIAVSQSPEAGAVVQPGTVVTVTFKHLDGTD